MFLKLALQTVVLACLVAACEWERAGGIRRPLDVGELEQHLRDKFKLVDVELHRTPDGQFAGEGKGDNGRDWLFSILQSTEGRTVVAKWTRARPPGQGESQRWIRFLDFGPSYLLIGFGYLVWVGKVVRGHGRS